MGHKFYTLGGFRYMYVFVCLTVFFLIIKKIMVYCYKSNFGVNLSHFKQPWNKTSVFFCSQNLLQGMSREPLGTMESLTKPRSPMIARCLLNIEIIDLQPMNVNDQNFRQCVYYVWLAHSKLGGPTRREWGNETIHGYDGVSSTKQQSFC